MFFYKGRIPTPSPFDIKTLSTVITHSKGRELKLNIQQNFLNNSKAINIDFYNDEPKWKTRIIQTQIFI